MRLEGSGSRAGGLTFRLSWPVHVDWQIYPALAQRRALAVRLGLLVAGRASASELPAPVLHSLAAEVVMTRVNLQQYPETYYFHDGPATSLVSRLPPALALAERASADPDQQRRLAGEVLSGALASLTRLLDEQYLGTGGSPQEIAAAYAREHEQR